MMLPSVRRTVGEICGSRFRFFGAKQKQKQTATMTKAGILTLLLFFLRLDYTEAMMRLLPSEEEEIEILDWFSLVRYLIGLGCIVVGCILLLYGNLASYRFLRRYQTNGIAIQGQVVSCTKMRNKTKKYEIQVLYTVGAGIHASLLEDKEYLGSFGTHQSIARGSSIDLLLQKDLPRSACTKDTIKLGLRQYSHVYTGMVLVPSLILIGLFIYLSILEIQDISHYDKEKWIAGVVLMSCLVFYVWSGISIAKRQFEKYVQRIFLHSVPVKKRNQSAYEQPQVIV